jgi:hypothetical protein
MANKTIKPLLSVVGVTALSCGTMLGFTAPAFAAAADTVAPVVSVYTSICPATTLLATLAPGQALQGYVVASGIAGGITRISDTTSGFTEDFTDTSPTPVPFTVPENTTSANDTVSACVTTTGTLGTVSLQVLDATVNPVDGTSYGDEHDRNRGHEINIKIENNPIAKIDDSGNSRIEDSAKVNDSGNSHNENRSESESKSKSKSDADAKSKSDADAAIFIKLHNKHRYHSYEDSNSDSNDSSTGSTVMAPVIATNGSHSYGTGDSNQW